MVFHRPGILRWVIISKGTFSAVVRKFLVAPSNSTHVATPREQVKKTFEAIPDHEQIDVFGEAAIPVLVERNGANHVVVNARCFQIARNGGEGFIQNTFPIKKRRPSS